MPFWFFFCCIINYPKFKNLLVWNNSSCGLNIQIGYSRDRLFFTFSGVSAERLKDWSLEPLEVLTEAERFIFKVAPSSGCRLAPFHEASPCIGHSTGLVECPQNMVADFNKNKRVGDWKIKTKTILFMTQPQKSLSNNWATFFSLKGIHSIQITFEAKRIKICLFKEGAVKNQRIFTMRSYCLAQWTLLSALWWRKWEGNPRGDICIWASQMVPVVKNQSANAGDIREVSSIPESERSPGGGHGNPYSCLENPMDSTVHRVAKCQIRLKRLNTYTWRGRKRKSCSKGDNLKLRKSLPLFLSTIDQISFLRWEN